MKELNPKGLSLAEILVALGIFAMMSLVFMGLTLTGVAQGDKGEFSVLAATQAEAEVERLKARPYGELLALVNQPPESSEREWEGHSFELQSEVLAFGTAPTDPEGRSLLIRVEVTWQEKTALSGTGGRSERTSSYELTGLVTPGLAL